MAIYLAQSHRNPLLKMSLRRSKLLETDSDDDDQLVENVEYRKRWNVKGT